MLILGAFDVYVLPAYQVSRTDVGIRRDQDNRATFISYRGMATLVFIIGIGGICCDGSAASLFFARFNYCFHRPCMGLRWVKLAEVHFLHRLDVWYEK